MANNLFFVLRALAGGLSSAALAYIINRILVDRWGKLLGEQRIVIYILPGVEEVLKNNAAFLLGGGTSFAYVFPVHFIFGLVEGLYDLVAGEETGMTALSLSVLSHSAFGLVALFLAEMGASRKLIILGCILPHIMWNLVVGRLYQK